MSAYLTLATPMIDQECLLSALAELGFRHVEVHPAPVPLEGYAGDLRSEQAEVVIRRRQLSPASNDIGFRRTPTGYVAVVSDYDRGRHGEPWLRELHRRYEAHAQAKEARLAAAREAAEAEARRRAEEEQRRLLEERRRLVEAQRQAVHERARRLGYQVQERREGERLRLVLVKRVY